MATLKQGMLSRRRFLQVSGLATSAALLWRLAPLPRLPLQRPAEMANQ